MKQTILTPCLLILIGFYLLNMLPVFVGGGFIVLGIVMLVERRWLEKETSDNND